MEDVLTKYKRLDPVNHQYFVDYLRYLQLRNIRETTITTKLWKIYGYLIWSDFRDAKTAQPARSRKLLSSAEKGEITRSPRLEIFKSLPCSSAGYSRTVSLSSSNRRSPGSMSRRKRSYNLIISRGILEYCESQRDRALVAVAWDSAGPYLVNCSIPISGTLPLTGTER